MFTFNNHQQVTEWVLAHGLDGLRQSLAAGHFEGADAREVRAWLLDHERRERSASGAVAHVMKPCDGEPPADSSPMQQA